MNFGLVILLGAGLVVLWLLLVMYSAWLLTHPPRRSYAWAVSRGVPGDPGEVRLPPRNEGDKPVDKLCYTEEFIAVPGARLAVWNIPGGTPLGPAVIVSHGWGDSRVVMLSRLVGVWAPASRIVLFDSRGHGESTGVCSLGPRETDDLLRVIEHVRETGSEAEAIVLYGFSLGAGAAIAAAARDGRIAAVTAEAPYRVPITPARNVLSSRAMPHRLTLGPAMAIVRLLFARTASWCRTGTAGGFDRVLHAARLAPPTRLLILSGSADVICPPADSQSIAAAGHGELVELPGGGHTDLWTDQATAAVCTREVSRLLKALQTLPAEGAHAQA